jgi:hypothetical protein
MTRLYTLTYMCLCGHTWIEKDRKYITHEHCPECNRGVEPSAAIVLGDAGPQNQSTLRWAQ